MTAPEEALIIAAGMGTRLESVFSPKPLIPVAGVPLIERVIRNIAAAGIERFKIVVGFKAREIMDRLGAGDALGVRIDYIMNDEWKKANGVSVLKAKGRLRSPFILTMSDHLCGSRTIRRLVEARLPDDSCLLCVDRKLDGIHARPGEATRVLVRDGKILRIGKNISPFNALDTGVFLCSEAVFQALDECVGLGREALSDANQALSDKGRLLALDIGEELWLDVDDPLDLEAAHRLLPQLS